MPSKRKLKITALAGGVGASKLLLGLYEVMDPNLLTIIVNTGDDIVLHGLKISPDLDIVTYTIAGVVDSKKGWGFRGETFHALKRLATYGRPNWFNLGDRDLATHIHRTAMLVEGKTLSQAAESIRTALRVKSLILHVRQSHPHHHRFERRPAPFPGISCEAPRRTRRPRHSLCRCRIRKACPRRPRSHSRCRPHHHLPQQSSDQHRPNPRRTANPRPTPRQQTKSLRHLPHRRRKIPERPVRQNASPTRPRFHRTPRRQTLRRLHQHVCDRP